MVLVAGFPILYAFYLSLRREDLRFPGAGGLVGISNYITVLHVLDLVDGGGEHGVHRAYHLGDY